MSTLCGIHPDIRGRQIESSLTIAKNFNRRNCSFSFHNFLILGLVNHDSGVGIYAPDPEAYVVFASLFNSIIQDYHGGFGPEDKHPKLDWGDISNLEDLDPNGEHIISTRVRCGRSIEGYPFNPCLTEDNYMEIEEQMIKIFRTMEGELEGEYKDLTTMSKEEQNQLIDDHFLFKEGDRFLKAANACRYLFVCTNIGRPYFSNS